MRLTIISPTVQHHFIDMKWEELRRAMALSVAQLSHNGAPKRLSDCVRLPTLPPHTCGASQRSLSVDNGQAAPLTRRCSGVRYMPLCAIPHPLRVGSRTHDFLTHSAGASLGLPEKIGFDSRLGGAARTAQTARVHARAAPRNGEK
jgi:hypothetical protein